MEIPFKIIFMDCNMPIIDGYDTTIKLIEMCNKYKFKKPYIVALTAYSKHELKNLNKKCLESGMDLCISKPINFEEIKYIF